MIQTCIDTPDTRYEIMIDRSFSCVEMAILADNLVTTTAFSMTFSDEATAQYFVHYVSGRIASKFQRNMSNTTFITELQGLVSTLLMNWHTDCFPKE